MSSLEASDESLCRRNSSKSSHNHSQRYEKHIQDQHRPPNLSPENLHIKCTWKNNANSDANKRPGEAKNMLEVRHAQSKNEYH